MGKWPGRSLFFAFPMGQGCSDPVTLLGNLVCGPAAPSSSLEHHIYFLLLGVGPELPSSRVWAVIEVLVVP